MSSRSWTSSEKECAADLNMWNIWATCKRVFSTLGSGGKRLFWFIWTKLERFLLYYSVRLFRIRDSSERVARGFAVGFAVNFFPTFGLGVFISGFLARMCGGNLLAGFVGGAILAFFWPFLFYLNMLTGGWVQGRFPIKHPSEVTEDKIDALVWGTTFTTGAVINSLVVAGVMYFLLLGMFYYYRTTVLVVIQKLLKRRQRKTALLPAPCRTEVNQPCAPLVTRPDHRRTWYGFRPRR
jgi:uncharacterized protein